MTAMMSGMNGHFPPAGAPWQEHRTPDGRTYYFNPLTKVTQWTKPEDLMSPAEVSHHYSIPHPKKKTLAD